MGPRDSRLRSPGCPRCLAWLGGGTMFLSRASGRLSGFLAPCSGRVSSLRVCGGSMTLSSRRLFMLPVSVLDRQRRFLYVQGHGTGAVPRRVRRPRSGCSAFSWSCLFVLLGPLARYSGGVRLHLGGRAPSLMTPWRPSLGGSRAQVKCRRTKGRHPACNARASSLSSKLAVLRVPGPGASDQESKRVNADVCSWRSKLVFRNGGTAFARRPNPR